MTGIGPGDAFGRLTVLCRDVRGGASARWLCRCECGRLVSARGSDLASGRTSRCGAWDHEVLGRRFGRLTVLDYAHSRPGEAVYLCRCDCGRLCCVDGHSLKSGNTSSCGCGEADNRRGISERAVAAHHRDGTNLAQLGNRPNAANTTGVRGVGVRKRDGRYVAKITLRGKTRFLGAFDTLEEAAEARRGAEEEMFDPLLESYGRAPTSEESYRDALRSALGREGDRGAL